MDKNRSRIAVEQKKANSYWTRAFVVVGLLTTLDITRAKYVITVPFGESFLMNDGIEY